MRREMPMAADLFGDLVDTPPARWRDVLPGLSVVAAGTLAAGFIADRYGPPLTLMALLMGLALNFLARQPQLASGLTLASRSLLRWGIVLLGLRVTFGQIADLGLATLAAIAGTVAVTIIFAVMAAKRLGFDRWFGMLAGGAVAICGASAALAIATTLGPRRATQAQLTVVLVGIAAVSAAAMILYPVAAQMIGLSDVQAGILLGGAIHDVAQALGAGYSFSDAAGHTAAIVKLTRVALLGPVLLVMTLFLPRGERGRPSEGVPWFVVGFFAVAALNSVVNIPAQIVHAGDAAASALLAMAVTAVALRSPLAQIQSLGWRPLAVILVSSAGLLGCALLVALLFSR